MLNPRSIVFNGLFWVGAIAWVSFFLLYSEEIRPAIDILVTNGHATIAAIWLLILLFLSGWAWGYDSGYYRGSSEETRSQIPAKQRKRKETPPPDWFEDY